MDVLVYQTPVSNVPGVSHPFPLQYDDTFDGANQHLAGGRWRGVDCGSAVGKGDSHAVLLSLAPMQPHRRWDCMGLMLGRLAQAQEIALSYMCF